MYELPQALSFSLAEYKERMDNVKKGMAKKGIDVLLITDPSNIYYLTGYDAKSFYVEQVLIVDQQDEMPTFIGRYMDAFSCALKTTWLDERHVFAYPDIYVQNPEKHPMDWISDKLIGMGFGRKTIGVEIKADFIAPYAWERYKANLTEARLVDGSFIVNWVRLIKSDREIEMMMRAGKITERIAKAFFDTTAAGVRHCDVAAAAAFAAYSGTEEYGGNYCASPMYFPRGVLGGAPHVTWDDQRFPENLTIFLETAGCYRRYHAPFSRTICIGEPPEGFMDKAKACVEALESVMTFTKEGVSCAEVAETFRRTMAKHGIEKEARIGYSTGVAFEPTWGEKTISLRREDSTVLRHNTCIHCLAALYYDNVGISISQAMRVTHTGIEKLYEVPLDVVLK